MTLSAWIVAQVENGLIPDGEPVQEITSQKSALQDENRTLRRDLELRDAKLRELETAIFKQQHADFLQSAIPEQGDVGHLIEVLRRGGTWSDRDLLAELGINPSDGDAIRIVTRQLHVLQDFGLAVENARGWRWKGEP